MKTPAEKVSRSLHFRNEHEYYEMFIYATIVRDSEEPTHYTAQKIRQKPHDWLCEQCQVCQHDTKAKETRTVKRLSLVGRVLLLANRRYTTFQPKDGPFQITFILTWRVQLLRRPEYVNDGGPNRVGNICIDVDLKLTLIE